MSRTSDADRRCERDPVLGAFRAIWALNFSSDVFIFVLPWLIVPDLMIKGWLRVGVYFTFLLGLINMTLSIVRYTKVYAGGEVSLVTLRKSSTRSRPIHSYLCA
jgi:hypothetical protein